MDPRLLVLAERQGGAFSITQARSFYGRRELEELCAIGAVQRVGRTHYALVKPEPPSLSDRILAAQTLVGRPVIACLNTAAELHGVGVRQDPMLHLTTENAWSQQPPPGVVLHQQMLRSEPVEVAGVGVSCPADTVIDVVCAGTELDALAVLDLALKMLPREQLIGAVERAKYRRGLSVVRRWLPHANALAASPMESRTRYRLLDAGLPGPELQVEVLVPTGGCRFLDLGWRRRRLGVDYEGEEFHTGTGAMARDRGRHNEVSDAGWRMFYPTARDIYRDHRGFTDMIRHALAA